MRNRYASIRDNDAPNGARRVSDGDVPVCGNLDLCRIRAPCGRSFVLFTPECLLGRLFCWLRDFVDAICC